MKKYLTVLSILLIVIALQPTAAHATSSFDTTYRTVSQLTVGNDQGCSDTDLTYTWKNYITDSSTWEGRDLSAVKTSFQNALVSGRIGVSEFAVSNGSGTAIRQKVAEVYWTEDNSLSLSWIAPYGLLATSPNSNGYAVLIGCANDPYNYVNSSTHITASAQSFNTVSATVSNTASATDSWGNVYSNFFVQADNPNYPAGYGGLNLAGQAPNAAYVAMGDSFSSGEGNPSFEPGSDIAGDPGKDQCHRSQEAYPRLLQFDASLNLGATDFVACSGATTDTVLRGGSGTGSWDEPAQMKALSSDTKVATITIGGNDVGFKDFATACTVSVCNFSTQAYTDIHSKIVNELPAKLAATYAAIDNATSSSAKVYVLGYPQLAPPSMPTGAGSFCWPLNGQGDDPDPTKNDGATAYAVVSELNNTIQQAAQNYGSSKFHYVDPNAATSPFIGHDWCQQNRYFDIVTLNHIEYSFHPNTQGQQAYAAIAKAAMQ